MTVAGLDEDVMRALHAEHGAALWSFALRLAGGDAGRADDIAQETLLRAWRHPDAMAESRGSRRSWLFTVARRIAIDEWRARTVRPEVLTGQLPERPGEDDIDRAIQGWLVAEALTMLSQGHRAVLQCCYYEGRSVREAAAALGIPEGTVKSRLHYGLRALRLALDEMGVSG